MLLSFLPLHLFSLFFLSLALLLAPGPHGGSIALAKTVFSEYSAVGDSQLSSSEGIVYELNSGESEGEAHHVYVPINFADTQKDERKLYTRLSGLPLVDADYTQKPFVILRFQHDEGAGLYLNAAVKNQEGNFQTVMTGVSVANLTDTDLTLYLSNICRYGTCRNLDEESGDYDSTQTLYFFTSSTALSGGKSVNIDQEDYQNGVYVKLLLSSSYTTDRPRLASVQRGDGQIDLIFDYGDVGAVITDNLFKILTINYEGREETSKSLQAAKAMNPPPLITEHEIPGGGVVTVTGLENGSTYYIGLALMNKHLFVSAVTATLAGTPIEMETFLREQGCYLISAGFQREHFVLNYFRQWRDEFLMSFALGRNFVSWYYEWAPEMAPYIYKSPALSALIRFLAYTVYYSMIYFHYLLLFVLTGLICSFVMVKLYRRWRSMGGPKGGPGGHGGFRRTAVDSLPVKRRKNERGKGP